MELSLSRDRLISEFAAGRWDHFSRQADDFLRKADFTLEGNYCYCPLVVEKDFPFSVAVNVYVREGLTAAVKQRNIAGSAPPRIEDASLLLNDYAFRLTDPTILPRDMREKYLALDMERYLVHASIFELSRKLNTLEKKLDYCLSQARRKD